MSMGLHSEQGLEEEAAAFGPLRSQAERGKGSVLVSLAKWPVL